MTFDLLELEAEFDKLPPEIVAEMEAEFDAVFEDGAGSHHIRRDIRGLLTPNSLCFQ
jgi:hypothetical protein